MRVLIESYNTVMQNPSGGVQNRIRNHLRYLKQKGIEAKLFNKWEDRLQDFDVLHVFKLNFEDYQLIRAAKKRSMAVVLSSVVPLEKQFWIQFNRRISKTCRLHTGYSFQKTCLEQVDSIVAQTQRESSFIQNAYGISKNKIHIIPNGVDLFDEPVKSDLIFKNTGIKSPFVLHVGRIDKNKNQLGLIYAMKNMDANLVFIGGRDPNDSGYYQKCKTSAGSNVYFLGWIEHKDPLLTSAFKNAHVVALPSFKEIFGNSMVEGAIAGANLVVTNRLAIEEWGIPNPFWKIKPHSVTSIRKAVFEALQTPKLNLTDIDDHLKAFKWENVVDRYINIYKDLT